MAKLTCIIVDDEATARWFIQQLSQNKGLQVEAQFANPLKAVEYLNSHQVDLAFIDIHMQELNGFHVINSLKNPPKIIFTTSDPKFAIEAFEYHCVIDYLLKPISEDRFNKAINRFKTYRLTDKNIAKSQIETALSNDLYVNIDKRLVKIHIPHIAWVEAKGDYIKIRTKDTSYMVHSTLKNIEQKLPEHQFLKVHRSYIINIKEIVDIEANSVLIQKEVIPVSKANWPILKDRINLL